MTSFLLVGCAAPDEIGLTADEAGRVSVQNCGTWITAVRVTDAGSGAPIWSAEDSSDADGAFEHSVGEVVLGQAPAGWRATGFAPSPGDSLRIVVESSVSDPRVLTASPPVLAPGAVYYDGQFRSGPFSDYCAPFYPYQRWVFPVVGLVAFVLLATVAIVVLVAVRHGRTRLVPPPTA